MQPFRETDGPIGCFIDDSAVFLAQIQRNDDSMSAIGAVEPIWFDRGDPHRMIADAVRRAGRSAPFRGRDVVTCIPHAKVVYKRLLVTPQESAAFAEVVRQQVAADLARDPRELCTDFHDAGELIDGQRRLREIIAVAAPATEVHATVASLRDAGLRPVAIDSACGAVARCVNVPPNDEPCCIIDLCGAHPVVIVAQSGSPRLVYPVDPASVPSRDHHETGVGIGHLSRAKELVAALAQEVNICAHYLGERAGSPIEARRGCIVGAGAWESSLAEMLTESSVVEFQKLSQILAPEHAALLDELGALGRPDSWVPPLGLAMYADEPVIAGPSA